MHAHILVHSLLLNLWLELFLYAAILRVIFIGERSAKVQLIEQHKQLGTGGPRLLLLTRSREFRGHVLLLENQAL